MSKKNIKVYSDLMGENDLWAKKTRELLKAKKIYIGNLEYGEALSRF